MNVLNNRSQRCWINCRFNIFYAVLSNGQDSGFVYIEASLGKLHELLITRYVGKKRSLSSLEDELVVFIRWYCIPYGKKKPEKWNC